jgi:hypothetical protein
MVDSESILDRRTGFAGRGKNGGFSMLDFGFIQDFSSGEIIG